MPLRDPTLEDFVGQDAYPCVGAKATVATRGLRTIRVSNLLSPASDPVVTRGIQRFAARAREEALFVSLVVIYADTPALDERGFETAMWSRLQSIHHIDARSHDWDPAVSSDPASPRFSLSIGGRAFYVIGMHPQSSRPARRFPQPALVFNLHSQFERLRADDRYEKLRNAIAERDIAYSGSTNPMLAEHGAVSEARQYSGRHVDTGWRCPFHRHERPR